MTRLHVGNRATHAASVKHQPPLVMPHQAGVVSGRYTVRIARTARQCERGMATCTVAMYSTISARVRVDTTDLLVVKQGAVVRRRSL